ncbi:MAG: alpha/beta fold hydrolase [Stackebrandtia sp.]
MDRRKLLRGGAVIGVATAAAATAGVATAATKGEGSPTFVFVNGSNGTGSTFNALGLRGHRSVAVELPGHSVGHFPLEYQAPQDLEGWAKQESPMKGVTLDDYVAAAVEVVETVAEFGPVILVGQSLGGATLSRVGNEIPERIDRIVYDTAFCCVDMPTVFEYMMTEEGGTSLGQTLVPWMVGKPAEIGANRTNWRSCDPDFIKAAKAALLADGTDEELLAILASLQPDESSVIIEEEAAGHKDSWGTIPRSYIRHTQDMMLPIALQDLFIDEADKLTPDNRFDVHTVETSHVGTTEKHTEILEILTGLV